MKCYQKTHYLDESVGRELALAGDHHGQVHHHELIAGVELGGAPVGEVGGGCGRVVHIGHVTVRRELHQLSPRAETLLVLCCSERINKPPDSLLGVSSG